MEKIKTESNSLIQITAFLITTTIIVNTMINGSSIFIPIVLSILIWMILNDMTTYISQLKFGRFYIPRPIAMGLIIVIVGELMLRFTGTILRNASEFSEQLPTYTENLNTLLSTIPDSTWTMVLGDSADLSTGIVEQLVTLASDYLADYVSTFATSLSTFSANAVYVIVYIIFLILEQNTFVRKSYNSFQGNQSREAFSEIMASIHSQVQTYLTVKTLVSFVTGLASYLVMWIFGLEYAIIWAVLFFLLNFIPNIGSIIALVFPVLMALLQFGDFTTVGIILGALGLIQVLVGYFVEPRFMGNQLNISPFVVLVALGVFNVIWGITGMLLSVPITVMIMIVLSHFDSTRFIAVWLSGDGIVHGIDPEEPETNVSSSA